MNIHGATVIKVDAPDYSLMKNRILGLAKEFSLRIVSGNGPIRVEGYKLTAFEMFKQLNWRAPDFESQRIFAHAGFFVEPATATSLWAVKKLRGQGKIAPDTTVVLMLTGSGLKDMDILRTQPQSTVESSLATIQADLHRILNRNRQR